MIYDTKGWKPIDLDDPYAAGHAWQRMTMLTRNDPFVGILTERTRDAINTMLFGGKSGVLTDDEGRIVKRTRGSVTEAVHGAFEASAVARMFSDRFVDHVADLAVTATLYGQEG